MEIAIFVVLVLILITLIDIGYKLPKNMQSMNNNVLNRITDGVSSLNGSLSKIEYKIEDVRIELLNRVPSEEEKQHNHTKMLNELSHEAWQKNQDKK